MRLEVTVKKESIKALTLFTHSIPVHVLSVYKNYTLNKDNNKDVSLILNFEIIGIILLISICLL